MCASNQSCDRSAYSLFVLQIYLLLGCSLPLILVYPHRNDTSSTLIHTSGLAILGVGDSLASIFGSRFGRRKWMPGISSKTIEGTAAAILGTFFFLVLTSGCCSGTVSSLVASVLVALLEAMTNHVDNLVLPPTMLCLLLALAH